MEYFSEMTWGCSLHSQSRNKTIECCIKNPACVEAMIENARVIQISLQENPISI